MGPPVRIVAQGIRLFNNTAIPAELVKIGLAKVDDFGLGLGDLNRATHDDLIQNSDFEWLDIASMTLDNGQGLTLVFDGDFDGDVPEGNPIFLNRPDLVGRELFVYAETTDPVGGAIVGNYALLGTDPVTGVLVPEPTTLALLLFSGLALSNKRHRP